MDIVLTFDDAYSQHASVVIVSVCLNNVESTHNFYIITDYISDTNRERLVETCLKLKSTIQFLIINKNELKNFPIGKSTANQYVTLATYYRLFLFDLLPKQLKRVLYLDCDIVVNGSLNSLWNWKFSSGKWVAALEEQANLVQDRCSALGYSVSFSYFNAGVILFDLEQIRGSFSKKSMIDYIQNNSKNIKFHDQDILNAIFFDKKEFIPLNFNVMDVFLKRYNILPKRYQNEQKSLLNPAIIHYSGPIKPWFRECNHPYKELYFYYLSKTKWNTYICPYKYNTLLTQLQYRLKCFLKSIFFRLKKKPYQFKKEFYNNSISVRYSK